jgi:hypothetical protein
MTWRRAAGLLLLAHGMAHTLPGMRAAAGFAWLPTAAWGLALAGFLGAGSGLLGAPAFRARWDRWAAAGLMGSGYLLVSAGPTPLGQIGLLADVAVLLLIAHRGQWLPDEVDHPSRLALNVEGIAAALAVALLTGLVLARPWHMRWGSTAFELQAAWPGDELVPVATYMSQHAVTIQAPPAAVWPWLAQLGQERGGFYSYAWLENLFGLGIRNADRIHAEWQAIRAGDTVYATPAGWLGMDRRLGWRVVRAERDRVLVLENWGAFILEPRNGATRLIVRSRGGGSDRPLDLALAPLGLLLFEPAHFIMQRKMLLELKRRAEEAATDIAGHGP